MNLLFVCLFSATCPSLGQGGNSLRRDILTLLPAATLSIHLSFLKLIWDQFMVATS